MNPAVFARTNRGKKSVAIDLKNPRGRATFLSLARHADVMIEGNRPGVMARLGLGYEDLRAVNQRLIYVQPDRIWPGGSVRAARRARRELHGARRRALAQSPLFLACRSRIWWVDIKPVKSTAGTATRKLIVEIEEGLGAVERRGILSGPPNITLARSLAYAAWRSLLAGKRTDAHPTPSCRG